MATSKERMKILKMLEEGKLTASEATALLNALGSEENAQATPDPIKGTSQPKWIRLKVTEIGDNSERANINLPIALVQSGFSFAERMEINIEDDRFQQLSDAIRRGQQGKIFDVKVADGNQRLEVYLE